METNLMGSELFVAFLWGTSRETYMYEDLSLYTVQRKIMEYKNNTHKTVSQLF
jgi:hypothetical protein